MDAISFKSKFKNHSEAKKALVEYYTAFSAAVVTSRPQLLDSQFGFTFGSSGWVNRTSDMIETSKQFSNYITKMLGARFGDEKVLSDLIQNAAHDSLKSSHSAAQFQDAVLLAISKTLDQDFEIYLPNRLVTLGPRIRPLKIGNVRVLSLVHLDSEIQELVAEIEKPHPNLSLQISHSDNQISVNMPGHIIMVPSSKMMWAVKVNVSRRHVNEEAIWQIGIAVSLMRLLSNDWCGREPSIGDIEPNAVTYDKFSGDNALLRNGSNLSFGGGKIPGHYIVDSKISKRLRAKKSVGIINNVFNHRSGTIGEQVYNALGWLSRGRQAIDRSEKLLYFFTAIEAVLSRGNDSPVIDTIARHGSVMLSANVQNRPDIAKRFKRLYGFRSSTVHKGARDASNLAVKEAELLASILLYVALLKIDMSQKHTTFSEHLSSASYGLHWP